MSKEALRTQLDALQVENQRLKAENAKLRDSNPMEAARADMEAEITRLTELVRKLQEENAMANSTVDTVETRIRELLEAAEGHREEIEQLQAALEQSEAQRGEEQVKMQEKLDSINKDKELECLRAVNDERRKWEAREERLLQQIAARGELCWRGHESGETSRDKERPHRSEES